MYTLEKIAIEDGKFSMVSPGHKEVGSVLSIFIAGDENITNIEEPSSIKVGFQVFITDNITRHLRTSPVKEIVEKGENYVVFRTQTSTYRLEKKEDV